MYLQRVDDRQAMRERAAVGEVFIPQRVHVGPSLVAVVDLVISGDVSMNREADIIGRGSSGSQVGAGAPQPGSSKGAWTQLRAHGILAAHLPAAVSEPAR